MFVDVLDVILRSMRKISHEKPDATIFFGGEVGVAIAIRIRLLSAG